MHLLHGSVIFQYPFWNNFTVTWYGICWLYEIACLIFNGYICKNMHVLFLSINYHHQNNIGTLLSAVRASVNQLILDFKMIFHNFNTVKFWWIFFFCKMQKQYIVIQENLFKSFYGKLLFMYCRINIFNSHIIILQENTSSYWIYDYFFFISIYICKWTMIMIIGRQKYTINFQQTWYIRYKEENQI